jgi:nicotinate-nucleotide adenylyltransferase
MTTATKRIGLFGGTFNPVHRGHLQVAGEVRNAFSLKTVYFIPSALPPHKPVFGLADARERMEMLEQSVSGLPGFTTSDIELNRSGPSYTVDTVRYFRDLFSADTAMFFILGMDAFLEIDTWKSYKSLFQMIAFVVMSRPESGPHGGGDPVEYLEHFVRSKISDGYRISTQRDRLDHREKQPIFVYAVQPVDISSTRIRENIRGGRPVGGLVPVSVENHIRKQGLYR